MATSGITSLSATRNTIIRGAFRLLGFKKSGGVRPAQEVLDAEVALNTMIKSWAAEDIGLWLNREITLYTDYKSSEYYSLGAGGDHATLTPQATAIATAASSGASSIVVDSADNITDGDAIGIELDDNTLQWTTVSSQVGTTVTLGASLTDDVAVDNVVYNYTTILSRPMGIIEARCNQADGNDLIVEVVSRKEYMDFSDKSSTGTPIQIYYDPQLTNSKLYVWPVSDNIRNQIVMTVKYPIELFSAYNDSPELPDEWMAAITYNLAKWLIPEYPDQLTTEGYRIILSMAKEYKENVTMFDTSNTSIFIQPNSLRDEW